MKNTLELNETQSNNLLKCADVERQFLKLLAMIAPMSNMLTSTPHYIALRVEVCIPSGSLKGEPLSINGLSEGSTPGWYSMGFYGSKINGSDIPGRDDNENPFMASMVQNPVPHICALGEAAFIYIMESLGLSDYDKKTIERLYEQFMSLKTLCTEIYDFEA